MKAIDFDLSTNKFVKEGCLDLPTYCDGKEIISCWNPKFKDKIRIMFGGKIWLHVMGKVQPPVYIATEDPFIRK